MGNNRTRCKDCDMFDRSRTDSPETGVCLEVTTYVKVMVWNDLCIIEEKDNN